MCNSCGKKLNNFTTETKNGNVKKKWKIKCRYQNEVIKKKNPQYPTTTGDKTNLITNTRSGVVVRYVLQFKFSTFSL